MAARGAESKAIITETILETFPGSFVYNGGKEIRIPVKEGGEIVQIKIGLTCAKENVEPGEDSVVPGIPSSVASTEKAFPDPIGTTHPVTEQPTQVEVTEQEKQDIADLMKVLNL